MPIVRTYACKKCGTFINVTIENGNYDAPAPKCPACHARKMAQEFKPVAIRGDLSARVHAEIKKRDESIKNDYGVADLQLDGQGGRNKVKYKDTTPGVGSSAWGATQAALQQAAALGKQQRTTRYADGPSGNGLDILQGMLKSGEQPDLIEQSKKKSARVW